MHLIEVVPLTRIPIQNSQILSYFSVQPLQAGCLVCVPLGRRYEEAIVVEAHDMKEQKMEIKKSDFELRPIKKILSAEPIMTSQQIKLALWLGKYYFVSPGIFLKMMQPRGNISKAEGLNSKPQTVILVPTLSQIEPTQKNYSKEKTAIIHSGLKKKELSKNWQKIARNEAQIIIGTRIAVFAPFINLKEIIIKEETNPNHRSYDMFPHYRVHEVAKKLAEIFGSKIHFESSLPSVENCEQSHCEEPPSSGDEACLPARQAIPPNSRRRLFAAGLLASMRSGRSGPRVLAKQERSQQQSIIIDLRQELKDGNFSIFSRALQQAIRDTLAQKKQIILFIGRRGAGSFVLCRDCGYTAKCANCDSPLTYHLLRQNNTLNPILICHHCGNKTSSPSLCPKCAGHRIKAFGSGSQRVENEAQKLFKNAKILRLDSDTAQTLTQQQKIIEEFEEKKADILIGTQMVLNAAGLTPVSLVAAISVDTLMHLPDFRSNERLFQTIEQLKKFLSIPSFEKGGVGRIFKNSQNPPQPPFTKVGGNFFIQTYNPQNKTLELAAKNDFKTFCEQEIATRKILKYPPFSQLIKLAFRHANPQKATLEAKSLFAKLTQQVNRVKIFKEAIFELIGPAPAFISKEKGKYIWQIIIKAKPVWLESNNNDDLLSLRNQFLMFIPSNWQINIDPETLL